MNWLIIGFIMYNFSIYNADWIIEVHRSLWKFKIAIKKIAQLFQGGIKWIIVKGTFLGNNHQKNIR